MRLRRMIAKRRRKAFSLEKEIRFFFRVIPEQGLSLSPDSPRLVIDEQLSTRGFRS